MPTKEYDSENPVTMAGEPAVAYRTSSTVQVGKRKNGSMTVDEYFDKIRKALDKRYEKAILYSLTEFFLQKQ